ncbi:hypothetical protein VCEC0051_003448A, partial [Vibrio cholerae O1 str. EC-0051]
MPLPLL